METLRTVLRSVFWKRVKKERGTTFRFASKPEIGGERRTSFLTSFLRFSAADKTIFETQLVLLALWPRCKHEEDRETKSGLSGKVKWKDRRKSRPAMEGVISFLRDFMYALFSLSFRISSEVASLPFSVGKQNPTNYPPLISCLALLLPFFPPYSLSCTINDWP